MGNARMRAEQINYGATNVKLALDDLDPKDLIALSARMDTIEEWKSTVKAEEKTGAYVEFNNALALNALSVVAEIVASQDLHGYDKPWVGGRGKNKLHTTATSATVQGVVYTVNSDGTISTADTATNLSTLKVGTFTGLTSVSLNGCPSGGGSSSYGLQLFDETASTWGSSDYGDGVTVTTLDSTHTYSVLVVVRNGVDASGLTFKPMIRTSGDSTWEPWDNICPITGYSSVTITNVDSESHTATVTVALGSTVYGGTLDLTSGELTITHANIASYNGETIGEPWISSMDEYTQGGTPTTGAQVVYPLATPTTTTLTAAQLAFVAGYNKIEANTGDITIEAYTGAPWGGDEAWV